jgi:hypothetical protein
MDYKKEIETVLDELKMKGYSRGEIEKDLDRAEDWIDVMLARGGNKKALGMLKAYNKRMLPKATLSNTKKPSADIQKSPAGDRLAEEHPGFNNKEEKVYTAEDVRNITESNRMMAEAMLIDARNREKLVDTNSTLTNKIFTADVEPKTPIDVSEKMAGLALIIADLGTGPGKRWSSKKEALAELYKLVPVPFEKGKGSRIHKGGDR